MAYVTGYTYTVLTNQSATIAYVTGYTYAVLTNQSAPMAYVTGYTYAVLTNQSAAIAYVTGHTYAVLTNQSTAIVYVTVCTSRGVRTFFDQSEHDILMRVRSFNMCAPSRTPSRPLKKKARSSPILLLTNKKNGGFLSK